jgi:hypothetical protein
MKLLLLGVLSLLSLASCKRVQGSCDQRAMGNARCEETLASTTKDNAEYRCTKSATATERGTWTANACEHTGAIAGCEDSLTRVWYYPSPSGPISKVEHVAEMCSFGRLIDANGKELKGVAKEPLADVPASDPALDKVVASLPTLAPAVAAIEKIKLPSGAPSGSVRPTGGKHVAAGAVVYERELSSFTDRAFEYEKALPLRDDEDFHACGIAVRWKNRQGKTDAKLKRVLAWCASLPYLLVVRTTKLDAPTSRTVVDFASGHAEGQVFVYELPTGKAIGGYVFKAESSAKVKASELDADFRGNIAKAITASLAKADPGATLTVQIDGPRR